MKTGAHFTNCFHSNTQFEDTIVLRETPNVISQWVSLIKSFILSPYSIFFSTSARPHIPSLLHTSKLLISLRMLEVLYVFYSDKIRALRSSSIIHQTTRYRTNLQMFSFGQGVELRDWGTDEGWAQLWNSTLKARMGSNQHCSMGLGDLSMRCFIQIYCTRSTGYMFSSVQVCTYIIWMIYTDTVHILVIRSISAPAAAALPQMKSAVI